MTAVQRTYLAPGGRSKAPVERKDQKLSLGVCKGGVVRLGDRLDGTPLLLGEGVETTLTAMAATGWPGWATLGTSGLKAFQPPAGVTDVVLLAERDESGAGEAAAGKAAAALTRQGMRVRVAWPPEGVKDFNDMVKDAGELAAAYEDVRIAIESARQSGAQQEGDGRNLDAEREAIAKLGEGDMAAFVARAASDAGFPFEPEAIEALNQLAKRAPDFERLRARLRDETNVRLPALDAAMRAEAVDGGAGDGMAGRPVSYDEIEPWDEAVNGALMLSELSDAIGAYVVMDRPQRDAVVLWAAFAHAHDLRDTAPLLIVVSPVKRCGKTRLQETLARLTPRPQPTSGITAALFARLIEKHRPTLFIDEYDAMARGDKETAEALRGQLNASFNRRSAVVLRLVPVLNEGWQERQFSCWAPTCVAGIGDVPDTVEDRALMIRLARKLRDEAVRRLRGRDGGELAVLARKLARFVADNEGRLRHIAPEAPGGLNDRQQDAWDPLLAIADVAGGDWPQRAREAALALCRTAEDEFAERDIKAVLLMDVRAIFAGHFPEGQSEADLFPEGERKGPGRPGEGPRLATRQLLEELHGLEERPWGAFGKTKKPLTDVGLAALLRPYGVRSATARLDDGGRSKGYYLRSFADAFARYLPSPSLPTRDIVTNEEVLRENANFTAVTNPNCHEAENAGNASKSGLCHDVTGSEAGKEEERDNGDPFEGALMGDADDAGRADEAGALSRKPKEPSSPPDRNALLSRFSIDGSGALMGDATLVRLAALGFCVRQSGDQAALDDDTGQGRVPPMLLLRRFADKQTVYGAALASLHSHVAVAASPIASRPSVATPGRG